jgi:hypothetical protein
MGINKARVWIGGLVGGVVWVVWSIVISAGVVGMARYQAAQASGQFLTQPRYRFFEGQWTVMLLLMGVMMAHLYAWARATLGPGPKTALKLGLLVGFMAGFPTNFGTATWSPIDRMFPLGWMLELWIGAVLATLVAGALYKE